MRITVRRDVTVRELLDEMRNRYGDPATLRRIVKRRPHDVPARVALHDWLEYRHAPPDERIRETHIVVIPDADLDRLTTERLRLLIALGSVAKEPSSVRALARTLERDIKNVSDDLRALERLGLVVLTSGGPGRPSRIRLAGDSLDLHLVESKV